VAQDGFATGRLSGLDISDTGVIFARYTNGENQVLGQVALANFANVQGLKNLGGTGWAETFESGEPVVGTPRSASLGALNAGALEDSNVELSEQLVNLIIAQRNFQASAKTIETVDAVTQTIMNLR
jgi:flagellar hook protein FlgE